MCNSFDYAQLKNNLRDSDLAWKNTHSIAWQWKKRIALKLNWQKKISVYQRVRLVQVFQLKSQYFLSLSEI